MKQLIIARKDLNMSAGKLAAQVSHASMAFISTTIRNNTKYDNSMNFLPCHFLIQKEMYEEWFQGSFTKIVCEAKNKNHLMKVVEAAKAMGLIEGRDFFLIKDNCLTELEPEEDGRTLTCIGFKPLPDETAKKLSKKYQLYRG